MITINLNRWKNKAVIAGILGCVLLVVLLFIAMLFYTGGNYKNPNVSGYSFWENIVSDLGRTIAYSGIPNTISLVLFSIALVLYAISFIPFYLLFPNLFRNGEFKLKMAKIGSILGIIASFSIIGIVFTPIDLLDIIHLIFASIAYLSLSLNGIFYTIALYINKDFPKIYSIIFLTYILVFFLALSTLLIGIIIIEYDIVVIAQKIVHIASIISFIFLGYGVWKFEISKNIIKKN
ncbi:MAG: hypothetical protein ACFFDX_07905 [Candidatus Odinarchaeota archaeon]